VRHRQTKGAATDMFGLQPLRHTSTLPAAVIQIEALPTLALPTSRSAHHISGMNIELDDDQAAALIRELDEAGAEVFRTPRALRPSNFPARGLCSRRPHFESGLPASSE
jgi:hypothetical protein